MKTTTRNLIVTLTATLVLSAAGAAHAALSLPLEADSFIDRNQNNNNFGADAQLRVKNENGNFVRKSYLRFDASGIGDVDDATLTINFLDTGAGDSGVGINWEFEVYGLDDLDAGELWVEGTGTQSSPVSGSGIDWNNAPANNTTSGNMLLGNASSLGTFILSGEEGVVNFSTPELADFVNLDTDGDVTLIVVRNTSQQVVGSSYVHAFASEEQTVLPAPLLMVTETPPAVPEPMTAGLAAMSLGALGMGMRRRRAA